MITARSEHASYTLGENLFVFCGWDGTQYLSSIEILNVTVKQAPWESLNLSALTKRGSPCVCPISNNEFLIMGGYAGACYLSDILIFNTDTKTAELKQNLPETQFACSTSAVKESDDSVIALVGDRDISPFMVRYTRSTNVLTAFTRFDV